MKNTKFGIASGTKLFTALGIGKLIEANKLNFDTRIADIDKEYCSFISGDAGVGFDSRLLPEKALLLVSSQILRMERKK